MSTIKIPSESIRRRFGRIEIIRPVIDDVVDRKSSTAQAAWNAVMQDFVVVHVEHCRRTDCIAYEGYHPKFEELNDDGFAFTPPRYIAQVHTHVEAHNITTFDVRFVRQ